MVADLVDAGSVWTAAAGGEGGRGNAKFGSSQNRVPLLAEAGETVDEVELELELPLLADVAVIVVPNAGKSSFLQACSRARPDIAGYPFTTLEPVLGFVERRGMEFVVVEIPGLLEGAHTGVGLTPWSPLARGILAGSYKGGFESGSTDRSKGRDRVRTEGLYRGAATFEIADRVVEVAGKLGKTPAQVSLAWLAGKPEVQAPVVGVSRVEQLDQLVEACDLALDAEVVDYLEELYQPVENLLSIGTS